MATKQELRQEICDSIREDDICRLQRALACVETVDDEEISETGRPLRLALWWRRLDMAQLLIDHGADPNYRYSERRDHMMFNFLDGDGAAAAIPFLLRNGSHIPRLLFGKSKNIVGSYVYRNWTHENHRDWPNLLRRQIVAVLCSMSSKKGNVLVAPLSWYLLSRLFSFVAVAHFVWE